MRVNSLVGEVYSTTAPPRYTNISIWVCDHLRCWLRGLKDATPVPPWTGSVRTVSHSRVWNQKVFASSHFADRSSSSFTQRSRSHSSRPTVFWPSRGKSLVCGAGSYQYGLIWHSVTSSQTVGTTAALAELLVSWGEKKKRKKKANIYPPCFLSMKMLQACYKL